MNYFSSDDEIKNSCLKALHIIIGSDCKAPIKEIEIKVWIVVNNIQICLVADVKV